MKLTEPQFLFIMHQLPHQEIKCEDDKIIVELIPKKVYLVHEYDEDGNDHTILKVLDRESELSDDTDIKNLFDDNYVTLENATKVLEDNLSKNISNIEI